MKLDLEFRQVMPSTVTPLEAVAMVKCLDESGEVTWYRLITEDLNLMEELGMLRAAVLVLESTVREAFIPNESEDGDED